ncbi:MAG TPA: carboxypeptidase-like regulatory domain-containing protein [Terriglobia bacterium]|nr:carboxypeptidase-like regulatory domain-containing protein [Terriglobia bacterium]
MKFWALAVSAAAYALLLGLVPAPTTSAYGALQAAGEKTRIEGTVTNLGTGQPLRNVRITLRPADKDDEDALEWNPGAPPAPAGPGFTIAARGFISAAVAGSNGLSTQTDAMGRYSLPDVSPGDYRVTADGEGFVRQEYGQRTATGPGLPVSASAGKPLTLDFQLTTASVISGRVFDPEGEPLIKTPVQAYTYRYTDGKRALTPVATAQTDDRGEYRLYWMQPGDYLVATMPRGGFSGRSVPPGGAAGSGARNAQFFSFNGSFDDAGQTTSVQMVAIPAGGSDAIYYPGVANPAEATLVRVTAGVDVPGIDFNLRPIRTIRVTGRIVAPFSLAAPPPAEFERLQAPAASDAPPSGANGAKPNAPAGVAVARGTPQIMVGQVMTIDAPPGIGGSRVELTLRRAGSAQSVLGPSGPAPTPVRPDGTFEIANVTPGSYVLTAIAKDPAGLQHSARMTIEAGLDDIRELVVPLQPGHDIRGRIFVDPPAPGSFKMTDLEVRLIPEGAPALPPPPSGGGDFVLAVRSPGGVFPGGDFITARVEEDGSFLLKDVAAALQYQIRVNGIQGGGYVVKGLFGSTDALGAPFSGGDPNAALQLQIGFSGGSVSGSVMDAAGKPYAGAVVALVPDKAHSGRTDLYFSTTSARDGSYSFNNLPPGSYRLFAWAEIPSGAFRSADFIQAYEDRAVSGAVDKRGVWNATLRLIPSTDR